MLTFLRVYSLHRFLSDNFRFIVSVNHFNVFLARKSNFDESFNWVCGSNGLQDTEGTSLGVNIVVLVKSI